MSSRLNVAKTRVLKVIAGITASSLLALVVWIVVRHNAPPLRLRDSTARVDVDVSTLGEYPTTVKRIRVSEAKSGNVVWELDSDDSVVQLHRFSLAKGQNAVTIDSDYGQYRVAVPSRASSFVLRPATEYLVEVWGGRTALSKSSARFEFPPTR